MKITQIGKQSHLVGTITNSTALGGITIGSNSTLPIQQGYVWTAQSSNTATWLPNVNTITANSSNVLLSPIVNFTGAGGIGVTSSSNTITISGQASGAGSTDAAGVGYTNTESGMDSLNVQDAIDELAVALDWSVDTLGSVTAGGSPVTVIDDASHNVFPGLVRLDSGRVLMVYRRGTTHLAGGEIYGRIGTLNAARTAVDSWGSGFLIYTNALDVRLEDGVSLIEDQIVIAARLYDGTNNQSPFLIICDDNPRDFTAASAWGSPITIPLTTGTTQNYTQGHVHKLANGTYILGVGWQGAGTHTVGVAKWSAALNDPSAASFVTVASGANDYAEIAIAETSAGNIRAMVRSVAAGSTYTVTSTDSGTTWGSPASAHDGYGYPMYRLLLSGIYLTVYRDAPNGDNAWRQTTTPGGSWGAETILDATGTRSAYASLVALTPNKILCAYAVEYSADGSTGTADIFTQVFTDSSTFAAALSGGTHSHASNTITGNITIANDSTIALTQPSAQTLNFSAPLFSEVVTAGEDVLVWHGNDLVHDLVRLY